MVKLTKIKAGFFDQFPDTQRFSIFSRDQETGIFERIVGYMTKDEVMRRIANGTSILNLTNCKNKEDYSYFFTMDFVYNNVPEIASKGYIVKLQ